MMCLSRRSPLNTTAKIFSCPNNSSSPKAGSPHTQSRQPPFPHETIKIRHQMMAGADGLLLDHHLCSQTCRSTAREGGPKMPVGIRLWSFWKALREAVVTPLKKCVSPLAFGKYPRIFSVSCSWYTKGPVLRECVDPGKSRNCASRRRSQDCLR
jgi:hypothetical protein